MLLYLNIYYGGIRYIYFEWFILLYFNFKTFKENLRKELKRELDFFCLKRLTSYSVLLILLSNKLEYVITHKNNKIKSYHNTITFVKNKKNNNYDIVIFMKQKPISIARTP